MAADVCVIFNPAAGRQRARDRLQRLQNTWDGRAVFQPTSAPGHAVELARRAALDGFGIVAAAGGDGTVHEVANGILLAHVPRTHFAVVPIGSANDYYHSLCYYRDTQANCRHVDVGVVRAPGGREKFFVCCLGLGLNGAVTLESRKITHLQGMALYGLATLRALLFHYDCLPMELTFDDRPLCVRPTLMLSVMLGRREGGFVLAPQARLDDGWFDVLHAGRLSRLEMMCLLPRVALAGPPSHHPKVHQGRCRRLHVASPEPLTVHIDGEFFARPEDKIRTLDIEIMPGVLPVRMDLDAGT